jgi:hypothetical protein
VFDKKTFAIIGLPEGRDVFEYGTPIQKIHLVSKRSRINRFFFIKGPVEVARIYFLDPTLKGPKHDQVECGFFYTNQTRMVR